MHLILLAAVARNRVIGANNTLPWHLPEDLKRFKTLTMGHAVAMGRKTFDSIVARLGKPLPGRQNLVLTRSEGLSYAGEGDVQIFHSVDDMLFNRSGSVFVIGGEQIYSLMLARASELDITEIDLEVKGDAFFPAIDESCWKKTQGPWQLSESGLRFRFVTYRKT